MMSSILGYVPWKFDKCVFCAVVGGSGLWMLFGSSWLVVVLSSSISSLVLYLATNWLRSFTEGHSCCQSSPMATLPGPHKVSSLSLADLTLPDATAPVLMSPRILGSLTLPPHCYIPQWPIFPCHLFPAVASWYDTYLKGILLLPWTPTVEIPTKN